MNKRLAPVRTQRNARPHVPASTLELSSWQAPPALVQRMLSDPQQMTPLDVSYLQRTVGNRAVATLLGRGSPAPTPLSSLPSFLSAPTIQPLRVGRANDVHEQQAERVARGVAPQSPSLQKTSAPNPLVEGGTAGPEIERSLRNPTGGRPLPQTIRRTLEPRLGADLSRVQVHTDHRAADLNRQLNAKAFTHKNHIYYGKGQSPNDLRITAHEAVHTVQQGAVPTGAPVSGIQRLIGPKAPAIQRLSLTIGDPVLEQQIGDMPRYGPDEEHTLLFWRTFGRNARKFGLGPNRSLNPFKTWGSTVSGESGKSFLDDEEQLVKQLSQDRGVTEQMFRIRDKWGDRYLEKHHKLPRYDLVRVLARMFGGGAMGKRRSFTPRNDSQRYLTRLGPDEDLHIIAHGGGDKIGGYTPAKLVRLLMRLGMDPNVHKGPIWLRGCLAAWRPDGKENSSFVEKMHDELRSQGFRNEVYGLAGLAMSHLGSEVNPYTGKTESGRFIGKEEEFDPVKFTKKAQHETNIKNLRAQLKQLRDNPGWEYKRKPNAKKWNPFGYRRVKKNLDIAQIQNVTSQIEAERTESRKYKFKKTARNWIRGSDYQGIGGDPVRLPKSGSDTSSETSETDEDRSLIESSKSREVTSEKEVDDKGGSKEVSGGKDDGSGAPDESFIPGPPSEKVEAIRTELERVVGIDTVLGINSVIDEVITKRISVYMLPGFLADKFTEELGLSGRGFDLATDYAYAELDHRGYRFKT